MTTTPADAVLPALPELAPLLPGGGLRRGTVVSVPRDRPLLTALAAGAAAGGWCAVVGLPEFGVLAAAGMGLDPERLLLVDEPGGQGAEVVAALAGGVEVVLLRTTSRPGAETTRRLGAVLRRTGSVLLVAGDWSGAQLRLRVDGVRWTGLGQGHGQLRGRQVEVVVEGRGSAARGSSGRLWLPAEDGAVAALAESGEAEHEEDRGRKAR
jgi:hypothetical protein